MAPNRRTTPNAGQYAGIALGLLVLTVYGSIIPLRYEPVPLDQAIERFLGARLYDPTLLGARGDWVVNSVQYAALSFFAAAALSVDRRWIARLAAAVVVTLLGFLAAVGIEFLQVYFPPRTVSINDLIVEGVGIVAGVVAWLAAGQRLTDGLRRFWAMRGMTGLARQAFIPFLGLLIVVSLIPFDFVIDGDEVAAKFRQGKVNLVPFALAAGAGAKPWIGLLTTAALFAPLGALAAFLPRRSSLSWRAILALGLGVTIPIEVLQLFVFSRYFDVTDIPVGTASVLAGWWLAAVLRDPIVADRLGGRRVHIAWRGGLDALRTRGAAPWAVLAALWAIALVVANWQPYTFSTDPADFVESSAALSDEDTSVIGLRRLSWAPLVDYYWASRFNALEQFLMKSGSFAPLGALLALAFGRRERLGTAATLLAAAALGVVIEAGQYFIPERHPGTSDPLIQLFGAWLGYTLTRHAAHAFDPSREPLGEARYHYGGAASARGDAPPRSARRPARPARRPFGPIGARFRSLEVVAMNRLIEHVETFSRWFQEQPHGIRVAIVCAAAVAASVGGMAIVARLGLL